MMATVQTSTGARPSAPSSAGTPVTEATRLLSTLVTQPAETARSLATRHVTTTTQLMGMDAVRTALKKLNGDAQHHHAVYRFAVKFVETGSSLQIRENCATMATR